MLRLVLANKNRSSWSLRPWLVLRHAGIEFEERLFPFEEEGWRDRVVELSPSRKVPALHHGDVVVWDSLAICEYIAELHPEAGLWPETRDARAFARSVSAEMHSGFAQLRADLLMDVVLRAPRRTRSQETESDIARILDLWDQCRSRFGSVGGPFLFGRFSIVDAMFAPIVFRFRSYEVPVESAAARAWYETMLDLPAMREWERAAEDEVRTGYTRPKGMLPDPRSAQQYFAVIFTSQHPSKSEPDGYATTASKMAALASEQPGYLGLETARNPDGTGITVSYWESLEAIAAWKANAEHQVAQGRGRESFYARYEVRVCSVEREYKFP